MTIRMFTIAAAFAAATLLPTATAFADAHTAGAADPGLQRQQVMKNVGAAAKIGGGIAKGDTPFDLFQAQLVMRTLNSSALGFGYLFPEGSEQAAGTEAKENIWSDRAGFDAIVAKFIADTSAVPTDEASFKEAFGAATANCGTCHKEYRK